MKHRVLAALLLLILLAATSILTYRLTMLNLEIETDGDGDSAIITVWGQSDLYDLSR